MFTRTVFGLSLFSGLALGTVHHVTVGGPNGETVYQPPFIYADVGDTVVFSFNPKNHTVSQSSLGNPCLSLPGGFDSGFNFPVKVGTPSYDLPQYNITVESTDPIWLRCRQGEFTANSDCGRGMVFAVNPGPEGSSTAYEVFQNNALVEAVLLSELLPGPGIVPHPVNHYTPAATSAAPVSTSSTAAATTSSAAASTSSAVAPTPSSAAAPTVTAPAAAAPSATASPTWSAAAAPTSPIPGPGKAGFMADRLKIVHVGTNGSLTYTPNAITANPGDIVRFIYDASNHTVTQSSYSSPCLPLKGGFNSGFRPVTPNSDTWTYYDIEIFTSDPIFIYCAQVGHCGAGMVMTINANESSVENTADFTARAIALNGTTPYPADMAGAAGARRALAGRLSLP